MSVRPGQKINRTIRVCAEDFKEKFYKFISKKGITKTEFLDLADITNPTLNSILKGNNIETRTYKKMIRVGIKPKLIA